MRKTCQVTFFPSLIPQPQHLLLLWYKPAFLQHNSRVPASCSWSAVCRIPPALLAITHQIPWGCDNLGQPPDSLADSGEWQVWGGLAVHSGSKMQGSSCAGSLPTYPCDKQGSLGSGCCCDPSLLAQRLISLESGRAGKRIPPLPGTLMAELWYAWTPVAGPQNQDGSVWDEFSGWFRCLHCIWTYAKITLGTGVEVSGSSCVQTILIYLHICIHNTYIHR